MNKRGQIYLIAALILSVAIFLLISQTNFIQRIMFEDDFEQIARNFDVESTKLMNSLLSRSEVNIDTVLSDFIGFTKKFTDYVKVENSEFEYIYVIDYEGQKIVGHNLKGDAYIGEMKISADAVTGCMDIGEISTCGDYELEDTKVFITEQSIPDITIRGIKYTLNLLSGVPQIVIISREEVNNQTKVYLNEEFITGEKIEI